MRNDEGWLLWFWCIGPFTIGIDLANWGAGGIVCFRRGERLAGQIMVGPVYLMWEPLA